MTEGRAYSAAEYRDWLTAAGLTTADDRPDPGSLRRAAGGEMTRSPLSPLRGRGVGGEGESRLPPLRGEGRKAANFSLSRTLFLADNQAMPHPSNKAIPGSGWGPGSRTGTTDMSEAGTTYEGSLLLTLEEISQLVAHSHNSSETLANIVRLIQGRFHTAVCSVYFFVPERGELVLGATVGLQAEAIGRVRMRLDEGLTGLVAQKMAPVAVADAFEHPRFKYFPEAGEDPYHSFLGVPLVEGGTLQGVLVVQTREPRQFSPSEVRMLVTVAAQLAALVGDALLLEQVSAVAHPLAAPTPPTEAAPRRPCCRERPSVPASAWARLTSSMRIEEWRRDVPLRRPRPRRRATPPRRGDGARPRGDHPPQPAHLRAGRRGSRRHPASAADDHAGPHHRAAISTPAWSGGATAEAALLTTLDKYVAALQKVATPFFHERIYDIKDVFHRILWQLRPRQPADPAGDRLVLVAREASVMELFAVDLDRLAAVVVEHGGPQSHAAILARSLGIPMVGQVADFAAAAALRPPSARRWHRRHRGPRSRAAVRGAAQRRRRRSAGAGRRRAADAGPARRRGQHQSALRGALRRRARGPAASACIAASSSSWPAARCRPRKSRSSIYRKLLQMMAGRPVTIRTFDLRPDKLAAYSHLGSAAARPFDWRLVLESPPLQQLFPRPGPRHPPRLDRGPGAHPHPAGDQQRTARFRGGDGGEGARRPDARGAGVRRRRAAGRDDRGGGGGVAGARPGPNRWRSSPSAPTT